MNSWHATGRLTDKVELRYSTGDSQTAVGTFSLAVDDGYGDRKKTSFFRCTAFGKTAEALEKYVGKGTKIAVSGRPRQDTWTDKEGHNRSSVGFIIDAWEFAQSAGENPGKTANNAPESHSDGFVNVPEGIDEELPFN